MNHYIFNVQTSVKVEAPTEEEAYELLNNCKGEVFDRDVLLVDTEPCTCMHPGAILTGGKVPVHVPGAYPALFCCGGSIKLSPNETLDEKVLREFG